MSILKKNLGFDIVTNGKSHHLSFEREKGKYVLYVDGGEWETFEPSNFAVMLFGDLNDYESSIDGVRVVAAMRYGNLKIAVDGKYIGTDEEFKRVLPLPVWGWGFAAAVMLPPIIYAGTFWDMIIAACFAYMCTHFILKNPDIKAATPLRILYCVIVTAVSWLLFAGFKILGGGTVGFW